MIDELLLLLLLIVMNCVVEILDETCINFVVNEMMIVVLLLQLKVLHYFDLIVEQREIDQVIEAVNSLVNVFDKLHLLVVKVVVMEMIDDDYDYEVNLIVKQTMVLADVDYVVVVVV